MKHESKNAKILHEQRKFSYDSIAEYHKKYIDPQTGYWNTKYTTSRSCPVCDNDDSRLIFSKSGGNYCKCNQCNMVFTNPVFTDEALYEYYTNLETGQGEIVENESLFYREIYSKGLRSIEKIKKDGRILDIGCSTGFFLDIAKESGWKTYGLELGLEEEKVATSKGHNVHTCTIEQANFPHKFDIITLWDVFEHIPEPYSYFKQLSKILKSDGLIFMQIPNASALAPKILQNKCKMFDGVEHCNLYSDKTIKLVINNSGFTLQAMESVISEIAIINNYLDYEDPYFGSSKSNDLLLGLIDEKMIHKNYLGYKLQIIVKKN